MLCLQVLKAKFKREQEKICSSRALTSGRPCIKAEFKQEQKKGYVLFAVLKRCLNENKKGYVLFVRCIAEDRVSV